MGNLSLIMVMSFLVGFSYVGIRQRATQEMTTNQAIDAVNKVQLKLITASGVNRVLDTLTMSAGFLGSLTGTINFNTTATGSFTSTVVNAAGDTSLRGTQVKVTTISTIGTFRDTSWVVLQYPSFSKFAYISNADGGIWFITGDTLRGPVHTNTYFSMQGTPAFLNSVSSHLTYSSTQPYQTSGPTNPYFAQTPYWGAPAMPIPTTIQPQRDSANANGRVYDHTTAYIQFNNDGTYSTRYATTGTGSAWVVNAAPPNGVIYVGNSTGSGGTGYNAYVTGTVSGRLTVASQGNIHITGDLLYANDPRINPGSMDMLGLVSQMDCMLENNIAGGDRTIMAHILTMNSSSNANSNFYNTNYTNITSNYLTIYGGLAQNHRGAVGQSGTPRTGYLKNYQWDPRLEQFSPPSYPLATILQQVYYWE